MDESLHVISSDQRVIDVFKKLFESVKYSANYHESFEKFFLSEKNKETMIVFIDFSDKNEVSLVSEIKKNKKNIFVVCIIPQDAEINFAIKMIRRGASEVLVQPLDCQKILETTNQYYRKLKAYIEKKKKYISIEHRLKQLTDREMQVLQSVKEGKMNKIIASELGINISTVELHRNRTMKKLKVRSVAELVGMLYFYSNWHHSN